MNNEDSVLNCKLDNNLSIRVPGKQVLFFLPYVDFFVCFNIFWFYFLLSPVSAEFTTQWVTEFTDYGVYWLADFWVY